MTRRREDPLDGLRVEATGGAHRSQLAGGVFRWAYTVLATGTSVAMTMQHWGRFADGKIVSFRGAEDTEQSAAAFSSPASPSAGR